MSGSHLLDTNIVSAWFKKDTSVVAAADFVTPVLCYFVLGELLSGVEAVPVPRQGQMVAFYRRLSLAHEIAEVTRPVVEVYARLRSDLRRRGLPTPENDIWIAATALSYDLVLVTRDNHFTRFSGLRIEQW